MAGFSLDTYCEILIQSSSCSGAAMLQCSMSAQRAHARMREHVQSEQGCASRRWHTCVSLLRQRAGLVANGRSNAGAAWVAIASGYAHAANAVRQRSHCMSQLPHDECLEGLEGNLWLLRWSRPDASHGRRDAVHGPPARRPVASNGGEHWRLPVHHDCIRCPPPGGAGTSCRTASPSSPGSVCSCSLSTRCQFLPDGSGLVAGGDLHREGAVA